jgi:hypothetical protein
LIGINTRISAERHWLIAEVAMNRRSFLVDAGAALVAAGAAVVGWRLLQGSMADYEAQAARLRTEIVPDDVLSVVRYATLAANSHNTQPWRFRIGDQRLDIVPDFSRRTPAVDPDDHHLFVSLGCAAANLAIAAAAGGRIGETVIAADGLGTTYEFVQGSPKPDPLLASIPKRQSTRADYDGRAVAKDELAMLARAGTMAGCNLVLLTDRADIGKVRDLVVAGNSEQMADPAFMNELKGWIRFNARSAIVSGDGLATAVTGNPLVPTFLGKMAIDYFVDAKSEGEKYARQVHSSAGVAIFFGDEESREHWIKVGQACQRFALTATSLGLKLAFVNQPVEVSHLRRELAGLAGTTKRPDLVLRFGYGPTLPYSLRRPVASVMA